MFSSKDVAEYYNTTQNHYLQWWNLRESLSLHYGIWEKSTKTFADSLINTNRVMLEITNITKYDNVLDAGCGVGGAAIYIHNRADSKVIGITISQKQVDFARTQVKERQLEDNISFEKMDYSAMSFDDNSFEVIWACESISSSVDKSAFIKEAHRVLKPGGRLILSDFFLVNPNQNDNQQWMVKWANTWSISEFSSADHFTNSLTKEGFSITENIDFTSKIRKSARRIYYAALLGALPSKIYNLFHPNVSRFAKSHYLSGYYQYKALKKQLWNYKVILATKG